VSELGELVDQLLFPARGGRSVELVLWSESTQFGEILRREEAGDETAEAEGIELARELLRRAEARRALPLILRERLSIDQVECRPLHPWSIDIDMNLVRGSLIGELGLAGFYPVDLTALSVGDLALLAQMKNGGWGVSRGSFHLGDIDRAEAEATVSKVLVDGVALSLCELTSAPSAERKTAAEQYRRQAEDVSRRLMRAHYGLDD
jgi:hypothetical protein